MPRACLNCGAVLLPQADATPPRFCAACGQETNVKPPTLGEFLQQFGGAYLSTEGALWRTLALLLLKPGELTRLYLAGRRKHYLLPLRLYLTVSVLMLLALRVGGALQVEIDEPAAVAAVEPAKRNLSVLSMDQGTGLGLRDGVFYCNQLPAWLCKRAQRRIDVDPKGVADAIDQFKDRFLGNVGAAMFLLLPSFALWLKLVYLNRRLRYTEHLVFALHVHAYWFLAFGLFLTGVKTLVFVAMLAVPWYTLAAMRRVYGGRRWPRLLRAAVVSALYGVLLALCLVFVALWSLLF